MNKKFITLCVSALLAGGMVTPAFAAFNTSVAAVEVAHPNWENDYSYYEIRMDNRTTPDWNTANLLKANFTGNDAYSLVAQADVDGYSLWRIVEHKNANGARDGFTMVNAYGIPLAIAKDGSGYKLDKNGSITVFNWDSSNGLYAIVDANTNVYIDWNGSAFDVKTSNIDTRVAVFNPASTSISPTNLASVFGDHFSLQIGHFNNKGEYEEYALEGNAFAGKLYPQSTLTATVGGTSLIQSLQGNDETYLVNENNEVIVLLNQKWNIQNTDLDGSSTDDLKGYKFTTMTAQELGATLLADQTKSPADKTIKSYIFRISGINAHIKDVAAPLEVAVKMEMSDAAYDAETWAELLVAGVDETYYLTTASAAEVGTDNTTTNYLDLSIADYTDNTYVRFGENNFLNAADFWGKAWNIIRESDEKTIVPNLTNSWVEKEKIGLTVPEGQWILFESSKVQKWINRETGAVAQLPFSSLRSTDEANVYEIIGGTFEGKYRITEAATLGGNHTEYFGYDVKESTVGHEQTYKIALPNKVTGDVTYISMDGTGNVELTADPTKAIKFQVTKVKTTDNPVIVSDEDYDANVDVFMIENDFMKYNEDKKVWEEAKDTVSFNRYYFSVDGKYLNFDETAGNYVLVDSRADVNKNKKLKEYVEAYIIKEKGGDFVNILNMGNVNAGSQDFNTLTATDGTTRLVNSEMLYFDFSFGKAYQQQNIYAWQANGQLNLDDNDYNIYRNVAPTAPDTMAIYRTEYQDEFLFEKNGFLGMTVDDRGYNAALFIDTAYVRGNTEKPLFMIGLRPDITPETVYCPIHGVDAGCAHEHLDTIPGYVDADYMTVLADSAAAHARELDNKFLANSKYTKLSFVAARHNVDTITVAADGHKTTISQNVQHPMVFAFRIVNQETQDFIIEGVDLTNNKAALSASNPYKTSWVRWNNGVPVMTDRMEDAEVFNINGDIESAPTANESIEAEATVSVVATDGAVIVKGAEGKNVIVSTILGKVVANEVVNSDNETIAAPAGIVVVSVDGESFKVAVK